MYGKYHVKFKRNCDGKEFEDDVFTNNIMSAIFEVIGDYVEIGDISGLEASYNGVGY